MAISKHDSRNRDLFDALSAPQALNLAFDRVRRNDGCSGGDGQTVAAFAARLPEAVNRLAAGLVSGRYAPRRLRLHHIPKPDGDARRLAIPAVSDRVVQTAAATLLTPLVEPEFSPDSYAFRPGRSVQMAVSRVAALRGQGYRWAVDADIDRAFDGIPHDAVMARLEPLLAPRPGGARLASLVALWLAQWGTELGTPDRGLAQGSPLSPLLFNLVLDSLDDAFAKGSARLVRFADDFLILTRSEDKAEAALLRAREVLARLGLRLNPDARVVAFERELRFLGHMFLRALVLPSKEEPDPETTAVMVELARSDDDDAAARTAGHDPEARVLHVTEPGRRLELEGRSFAVTASGTALLTLAPARVARIELAPSVGIDEPVLRRALATGTEIAFLAASGETMGTLSPPLPDRAGLHLAQAAVALDPALRVDLARRFVAARLRSQRARLQVLNRRPREGRVMEAVAALGREIRKLPGADNIEALLGHEGHGGSLYWPALGLVCKGAAEPFRRSRPARDAPNAALNYLTALLARDVRAAVQGAGLHPGLGVLHAPADRHEAMVWDLMEVFRAAMVEGVVIGLFNRARLKPEMFETGEGGVRIASEGRRALILGYESAASRPALSRQTGRRHKFRRLILEEARAVASHMRDPAGSPYQAQEQDY